MRSNTERMGGVKDYSTQFVVMAAIAELGARHNMHEHTSLETRLRSLEEAVWDSLNTPCLNLTMASDGMRSSHGNKS